MDKLELIRCKLLELGIDGISSYDRAKLRYMRKGDESALNDMIKAAILCHGVCQIAEFTGVASYDDFEQELVRGWQAARPAADSPEKRREAAHASDMVTAAFNILKEKREPAAVPPDAAQRD